MSTVDKFNVGFEFLTLSNSHPDTSAIIQDDFQQGLIAFFKPHADVSKDITSLWETRRQGNDAYTSQHSDSQDMVEFLWGRVSEPGTPICQVRGRGHQK